MLKSYHGKVKVVQGLREGLKCKQKTPAVATLYDSNKILTLADNGPSVA